ncbi:hypothetical protein BST61_g8307 [Cercospora zeina]
MPRGPGHVNRRGWLTRNPDRPWLQREGSAPDCDEHIVEQRVTLYLGGRRRDAQMGPYQSGTLHSTGTRLESWTRAWRRRRAPDHTRKGGSCQVDLTNLLGHHFSSEHRLLTGAEGDTSSHARTCSYWPWLHMRCFRLDRRAVPIITPPSIPWTAHVPKEHSPHAIACAPVLQYRNDTSNCEIALDHLFLPRARIYWTLRMIATAPGLRSHILKASRLRGPRVACLVLANERGRVQPSRRRGPVVRVSGVRGSRLLQFWPACETAACATARLYPPLRDSCGLSDNPQRTASLDGRLTRWFGAKSWTLRDVLYSEHWVTSDGGSFESLGKSTAQ